MQYQRLNDLGLLLPIVEERARMAIKATRGQGFGLIVWETERSKERAQHLVATGKSKAKGGLSMHCYKCALDVVCETHKWDCRRHHCRFFETWGLNLEDVGMTWGGRWKGFPDMPHGQLPPVRLQDKIRSCPAEHLDTLCRAILAGEVR